MTETLPGGTVTFLLTDIEGSTRLWEDEPDAMRAAVARHDELVVAVVGEHGGHVVKPRGEGDAQFTVFARASDAAGAALALQQAMTSEPWSTSRPLRMRIGIHTGEAELRDDDYYGPAVNRAARIKAVGHGGQTLLSQATADLVRDRAPAGAVLTDLGSHRLKDLSTPEHLAELRPADAPAFPPLRSLDYLPTNLPQLRTSFVGRDAELARVGELVQTSRLVTLTGPGGCGKTRLALHVGGDQLDQFVSGTWFVDLAPVRDPGLVPAAVAVAIGAGGTEGGADLTEHVLAHLRPLALLLVVDNCEHLVDAAATFVDQVMARCPNVRIVATSREPLGVDGEAVFRIPSLGNNDAVALFEERAGVTAGEPAQRICRQLDGIPLAIELAAARARSLGVKELADRIDDLFRMLRGGSRTAVARQQTLEAAIDWSHELLEPEEQVLFRRLTVFSGGFTLGAVEAVCAEGLDGDPIDLLAHLLDKSLVEHDDDRERYGMLEALRQYGGQRLQSAGEVEALRDRHLRWMVAMLSEATPDMCRRGYDAWSAPLHDELGNLRAATEWALATDDGEAAAIIAGDTGFAWANMGAPVADDLELVRPVLELALTPAWRSYVVAASLYLAAMRGDIATVRLIGTELGGEPVDDDLAPERGLAVAVARAWSRAMDSHYDLAVAVAQRIAAEARRLGLRTVELDALGVLIWCASSQEHHDDARRLGTEAAALARRMGCAVATFWALTWAGNAARAAGDQTAAREVAAELLAVVRERGVSTLVASALNTTAYAFIDHDPEYALACAAEGIAVSRTLASSALLVNALHSWGELHLVAGRSLDVAVTAFAEAAEMARAARNLTLLQASTDSMALARQRLGDLAGAQELTRLALQDALTAEGDLRKYPRAYRRFAELASAGADHERAAVLFGALDGRTASGMRLPAWEVETAASARETTRAALGDPAWEAATARGAAMTDDEAIAFALDRGTA